MMARRWLGVSAGASLLLSLLLSLLGVSAGASLQSSSNACHQVKVKHIVQCRWNSENLIREVCLYIAFRIPGLFGLIFPKIEPNLPRKYFVMDFYWFLPKFSLKYSSVIPPMTFC